MIERMQSIDLFVFGHYDSRGGTMGIAAGNMHDALVLYILSFGGGDAASYEGPGNDELLKNYWDNLKDDWMFNATLFMPETVQLPKGKTLDLENELGGHVITQGDETDWLKILQATYGKETIGIDVDGQKLETLEFVPQGEKPIVLKRFKHPCWDDDAYSFCVVTADSYDPAEVAKMTQLVKDAGLEAK